MLTVITGGGRGIGAATARRLARDGHDLVLSYAADRDAAEATATAARERGVRVEVVQADVADPDQVDRLFDVAAGLGQVTGVVNNAGSTLHLGDLADTPVDVVRRVIDVNLTGAVLVARRAVQDLVAGGAVVNVSSAAATLGAPHEYVHYAAAKAGVDALTVGLAQEVAARGIRVNGVAPGDRAHRASTPRPATRTGSNAWPARCRWAGSASRRRSPRRSRGCCPTLARTPPARRCAWQVDDEGPSRAGRQRDDRAGRRRPARGADRRGAGGDASVAELVASDIDVVITHGNGPQVGNLLVKNEIAASVVPPVPLDWCGAQTQATLGFVLMNALDDALRERGVRRRSAAVVTRTLVDADDPGFTTPSKPIGRYLPARRGRAARRARRDLGGPGREGLAAGRRLAGAPRDPRRRRGARAGRGRVRGGRERRRRDPGGPRAGRSARRRGGHRQGPRRLPCSPAPSDADVLVVATDVPHAVLRFGTPDAEDIGRVDVRRLRELAAEGHFAGGSMGPKVEAVCRFVEQGGTRAVITTLDRILDAVAGETGTVVVPT